MLKAKSERLNSLCYKLPAFAKSFGEVKAEGAGFELAVPFDTTVFKTVAVNHLATLPMSAGHKISQFPI